MKAKPETTKQPVASTQKVRIEVAFKGESFAHEVATEVFRKSIDVESRGDQVKWKMDVVRIIMSREAAKEAIRDTLAYLEPEDQWAIIQPVAEELERRGIFRPRSS